MANFSNHRLHPRLLVLGYVNRDVNCYPNGLQRKTVGGGAYFAAVGSSAVSQEVGLVTRVGGDFDLSELSRYVRCDGVAVIKDGQTAHSIQTYHDQSDLTNRSITLIEGVNSGIVADDIPSEWLANASLVLVSTMVPSQQQEIVRTLVSKKRGQSSRVGGIALQHPIVAVDSDQCWLREDTSRKTVCETMKLADIAFMNRVEWETFREIAREIPIVVLKRDSEGASVLIRGEVAAEFPAPHVEVVDVTGAGDVLAGTFLAHLSQGRDLPGALSQAIFAASQSITKEGVVHLHGRSNS